MSHPAKRTGANVVVIAAADTHTSGVSALREGVCSRLDGNDPAARIQA